MSGGEPDRYVIADARSLLAEDPRVGELSLTIELVAGKLCVSGTVASEARRAAIEAVLGERFPDLQVVDQTTVADMSEAVSPEGVG